MAARPNKNTAPTVRVALISLDSHLSGAVDRARCALKKDLPGLELSFHAASDWSRDPASLETCKGAIAEADFVVASMLFLEDHIKAVLPALEARREHCDAMVGCLAAADVVKLTRLDRFRMDKPTSGPIAMLKRLRGSKDKAKAGASQIKMLRRVPKLLKFIPGTAQDVRAYFLTLQYWLAGSEDNIANLVRYLVDRYASGPREHLRGTLNPAAPAEYPEVGVYHPRMKDPVAESAMRLPLAKSKKPAVGLLIMRSYVLSGDAGHYDGVIAALEARGLRVIPAFASGLDSRPAIEKYFMKDGAPVIDALVSLTGFSLVGGPAYNDAGAAAEMLAKLDIPYLSAQGLEFQSLDEWRANDRGLTPVEATMMVAIPELDGATGPIVFGGRAANANDGKRMQADSERADMLAARVEKLIRLRKTKAADRKLAISIFNFPPNGGGVGTAAHLGVFESLHNTLKGLARDGYTVDVPENAEALRAAILGGNAELAGADANVCARVAVDDYIRSEKRLADIEAQWGPAPGRHNTDGRSIQILGAEFGNVFVGVQPAFGYEGDPMRLLFEKGFAPTHAFAAFYRYIKDDFDADAILHFGTHGALEFMPGKHAGMSEECWSDYLIGDLPNFYFYAANNPSEATIAKRRSAATTISYLTPSVTNAGLYKELSELKALLNRWRAAAPGAEERNDLVEFIQAQAVQLELAETEPIWTADSEKDIERLRAKLTEVEDALIPNGLHVAGEALSDEERIDMLAAQPVAASLSRESIEAIASGASPKEIALKAGVRDQLDALTQLAETNAALQHDSEIPSLVHALSGGFVKPVAGGDLIRDPSVLPTGRNIHGFDPFRLPSAYAVADGARQADRLLTRHKEETGALPETVAIVLWGTDNLKSEGAQVSQALALIGAKPRFDSYGRLAGADLVSLEELGRPRIDVVATLSGIFRDLLPLQTRMLAEAALAAAQADEPLEQNFIRKHALRYQEQHGCDFETAALRVFSNADGAYGANVNQLVEAGCWNDEDELADAYATRKCFAYGASGEPAQQSALLGSILEDVDLAYQNLESVELGLTTIDHYFDTLGGIGRAVKRARGQDAPVYIGDQTRGGNAVRTLSEQVALEARTRTLNPKWYEGMLRHGYEGVRQIEAHVTNTMGWSATTGQVDPWIYQRITETFVLDTELRNRLAELNPKSCAKVANRLLEASDRQYWSPDDETLEALRRAGEDLEDRIEGVTPSSAAVA
ncbi:MAG: magnesium chelatase subunit H [Pseudomonadota bacterium]